MVIVIIALLATSASYGVRSAQRQAKQTHCKSNLRQFGVAVQLYRAQNNFRNPAWLSNLYPEYIDSKHLYTCRSDPTKGEGLIIPQGLVDKGHSNYPGINDQRSNGNRPGANTDIEQCSYFYEFSMQNSAFGALTGAGQWPTNNGNPISFDGDEDKFTWCDWKENQLRFGDQQSKFKPYSSSQLPIVRCWHHHAEAQIDARPQDWFIEDACPASQLGRDAITLNVSYEGNVYVGPLKWECTRQPGDGR